MESRGLSLDSVWRIRHRIKLMKETLTTLYYEFAWGIRHIKGEMADKLDVIAQMIERDGRVQDQEAAHFARTIARDLRNTPDVNVPHVTQQLNQLDKMVEDANTWVLNAFMHNVSSTIGSEALNAHQKELVVDASKRYMVFASEIVKDLQQIHDAIQDNEPARVESHVVTLVSTLQNLHETFMHMFRREDGLLGERLQRIGPVLADMIEKIRILASQFYDTKSYWTGLQNVEIALSAAKAFVSAIRNMTSDFSPVATPMKDLAIDESALQAHKKELINDVRTKLMLMASEIFEDIHQIVLAVEAQNKSGVDSHTHTMLQTLKNLNLIVSEMQTSDDTFLHNAIADVQSRMRTMYKSIFDAVMVQDDASSSMSMRVHQLKLATQATSDFMRAVRDLRDNDPIGASTSVSSSSSLCHVCGKTCDASCASAVKCGQCQHAVYCSEACQARDWVNGKHALECWDRASQSYDTLSREIVADLQTRTSRANFPEALGQPLHDEQVDAAHFILHKLEQQRDPLALEAAHAWLSNVRVNHVGAIQHQANDVDLLDMVHAHHETRTNDPLPKSIQDIEIAFDVQGTLDAQQRVTLQRYIASTAFDQRESHSLIGDGQSNALVRWWSERKAELSQWRGKRKEYLKQLRTYRAFLEQSLAWVNKEIRKKSWNPLSKWRARRREKGAKKRW